MTQLIGLEENNQRIYFTYILYNIYDYEYMYHEKNKAIEICINYTKYIFM